MKNIILILSVVVLGACGEANFSGEKEDLREQFKKYIQFTNSYDFDSVVAFYPKDIFDESEKIEDSKRMYDNVNQDYMVEFKMNEDFEIDTIISMNDTIYARISYQSYGSMDLGNLQNSENGDEKIQTYIENEEQAFGPNNVKFNEKTLIITTTLHDHIFCRRRDNGDWDIYRLNEKTISIIPELIK